MCAGGVALGPMQGLRVLPSGPCGQPPGKDLLILWLPRAEKPYRGGHDTG